MSGSASSDLSGLLSLARTGELDLRPVILRVQTDLFASATSRDRAMIEAFEALACGLLPRVDDETAALIARKLAPIEDTPERLLHELVARGGEARRAVIEAAPRLSPTLADGADAGPADLAVMLAARRDLTRGLIDTFVARDDEAIDLALARNTQIALTGSPLILLIGRAQTRADLASALLARPDLKGALAAPLYLFAADSRRGRIRDEIGAAAALRATPARRADRLACAHLVELAARMDADAFGAGLAAMLGLDFVPDWRFHEERRHELLVLALIAAGVAEEDAVRVFLTLEPTISLSVDRVYCLVALFREIPRAVASFLIEAVLHVAIGKAGGQRVPHPEPAGALQRPAPAGRASGEIDRKGSAEAPPYMPPTKRYG
jgi:hypothetical protein